MKMSFRFGFCLILLALPVMAAADEEAETSAADQDTAAAEAKAEGIPLDEIRTFTEVFSRVKSDYVDNIGDQKLLENAIRGMLAGLDPHSSYLDEDAYKTLQEGTSGEFGGLGLKSVWKIILSR